MAMQPRSLRDANRSLREAGSWEEAEMLLRWMEEAQDPRVHPNIVSFTIVVKKAVRERKWGAIDTLLQKARARKCIPDNIVYSTIIHGAVRVGRLDIAEKWFGVMREVGCEPDIVTYNSLLSAFARTGEHKKAQNLLEEMRMRGASPDRISLCSLLTAYRKAQLVQPAVEVFEQMRESKMTLDLVSYSTMMDIYGKSGRVDEALTLFQEMRREGCEPDLACWNIILRALGKAKRVEEMEEMVEEMKRRGLAPDRVTLSILIWSYGQAGQEEQAGAMFMGMDQVEGEEGKGGPDEHVLCSLMSVYGSVGMPKKAMDAFEHSRRRGGGILPGPSCCALMVAILSREGKLQEAREIFQTAVDQGGVFAHNEVLYGAMIDAYGKAGQVEDALALWDAMTSRGRGTTNIVVFNSLLDGLGKAGKRREMDQVLAKMTAEGVKPDPITMSILLNARCEAGEYVEAIMLFESMRSLDMAMDMVLYGTMIKVYTHSGMPHHVIRIYHEIQEKGLEPDAALCHSVLVTCRRARIWPMVKEVTRDMAARGMAISGKRNSRKMNSNKQIL